MTVRAVTLNRLVPIAVSMAPSATDTTRSLASSAVLPSFEPSSARAGLSSAPATGASPGAAFVQASTSLPADSPSATASCATCGMLLSCCSTSVQRPWFSRRRHQVRDEW